MILDKENPPTSPVTIRLYDMKDVVWFLENRMKLTVHGKELIGLN